MPSLQNFLLWTLVLTGFLLAECKKGGGGGGTVKNGDDEMSFQSITCKSEEAPVESDATVLNDPNYWENLYGRSGASWPRRGFQECWASRGAVCALPDEEHVVCLPGSRRGSTVNNGWALDPRSQPCRPGVHCLYACEPGYYWTQFNQEEPSSFDEGYASKKGQSCDGRWHYGSSTHGVYCDKNGVIQRPLPGPLCQLGETYVFAENRLDTHIFLCQTVFPGHEIFLIPTLVKPGETVMLTTHPKNFWTGPSSSKPTHGDFYASFAGADIMEACTRDEVSPSGAALLPYEIGTGVEDNGVVYSTHYFYQQPNSEIPIDRVGYELELRCESKEKHVCGPVVHSGAMVKLDVLKQPKQSSSQVKFVFKKPSGDPKDRLYKDPSTTEVTTATTRTSSSSTKSSTQTFTETNSKSSVSGRKLMSVGDVFTEEIMIENTLGASVVVCEEGSFAVRGRVIRPGKRIALDLGKSFFIGREETADITCQDLTGLPWKLWTGATQSETDSHHQFMYTLSPLSATEKPDYGLFIKCVSEAESCQVINAQAVEVNRDAGEDSFLRVIFVIKPFQSVEQRKAHRAYEWGSSLLRWMLPLDPATTT